MQTAHRNISHSSSLRSAYKNIRQSLSLRLGLLIISIITIFFFLILNLLFYPSKEYVRKVAFNRATQLLDNTVLQINGIMDETELVGNYLAMTTPRHLYPDSLLAISRKAIIDYPFLTGMAISMEPYFFPEMGRYFSAYSLRQDDTITTVREGPFEYFEKIWYKTPRTLGTPYWVDAFDDYNEGTLSSKDILTSYCCPMRDGHGQYIGSITASLTLKWLSAAVTGIEAYPHSSAIMIGRTGTYLIHPDTAKLFRETIFSDAAPESKKDIMKLGKNMLEGRSGMLQTMVDGLDSYIFYRPLERTGWSIAIVCPESDVFSRYHKLLYTVWIIIGVGLLLLLLFCYQSIRTAVQPLKLLAYQAGRIADGHFDEDLPQSTRQDSIGRLTNSFVLMQQSLSESVANVKKVNEELEQHNQELAEAYKLQLESNEKKTIFIREMSHHIRTPLNIISGFCQVLLTNLHELPEEEVADITARMKSGAKDIGHIAWALSATSASNSQQIIKKTTFACNELCREALASLKLSHPDTVKAGLESEVDDAFTIYTDRQALRIILNELLDNSNKFTTQGHITIECRKQGDDHVCFSVSDTGPGIPASERDNIFFQFTKIDTFTEGIGLGLSLCRHTARQLEGDLIFDKTYKYGTRFVITLPVSS